MFNKHDIKRDEVQLYGQQSMFGYDWWWHSFTAKNERTGEDRQFFIEFFLINPGRGGDEPVLGQLRENKRNWFRPSYLMVKCGAWGRKAVQLHRFFGWNKIDVKWKAPFAIMADDCFLNETETSGSVSITPEEAQAHPEWMCGAGEMSWDLKIDKKIAFNVGYGAGRLLRKLQLFEMSWHAEGMKTEFTGEVTYNGERYIVSPETCRGYADKNWGRNFTSPWVWLSSSDLTSELTGKKLENSVFDIGGGRPKLGKITFKGKLLSAFWYEGKEYEFNFSKFWTGVKTKFSCHETDFELNWHVEQWNRRDKIICDITCNKSDMLLINYEAPTGQKRHNRLWNGGNGRGTLQLFHKGELVDRIAVKTCGCEYGEFGAPAPGV